MVFKSRKSFWIGIVLGAVCLLLTFTVYTTFRHNIEHWFNVVPMFAALIFLIWIWFDTYYEIENKILKYKSAFIKGSIDIAEIKEIVTNTTSFIGLKPALASKGLIVKFKRWDEIYISPENTNLFLDELLKINPEISITTS